MNVGLGAKKNLAEARFLDFTIRFRIKGHLNIREFPHR